MKFTWGSSWGWIWSPKSVINKAQHSQQYQGDDNSISGIARTQITVAMETRDAPLGSPPPALWRPELTTHALPSDNNMLHLHYWPSYAELGSVSGIDYATQLLVDGDETNELHLDSCRSILLL